MLYRLDRASFLAMGLLLSLALAGCSEPAELKVQAVKASSFLVEPSSGASYPAALAFDGNVRTAWAEGKQGLGQKESIKLTFNKTVRVDEISIVNGFGKSASHYVNNGRVSVLTLKSGGDAVDVKLAVSNTAAQRVKLSKSLKGKSLELVIKSATGGKYKDTCISEVGLYYQGKQIAIPGMAAHVASGRAEGKAAAAHFKKHPAKFWLQYIGDGVVRNDNGSYVLCYSLQSSSLSVGQCNVEGFTSPTDLYDFTWSGRHIVVGSGSHSYGPALSSKRLLVVPLDSGRISINGETFTID